MTRTLFTMLLIMTQLMAFSQTAKEVPAITFRGKLTFERKMNAHKQMDEMMKGNGNSAMADNFKKQIPKYKTDIFEMIFNDKQSIYKPGPEGISESKMMMGNLPADRNIVFNDYETKKCVSEKKVYEKTYLVSDTLKKYEWKITEEFRTIAGYNCRRAETVIMDSVYVIAFYTDGILAEGGPEGFNGLPGMILGVVMPRLNITYFATQIENFVADEKLIVPPTKGDKTTYKTLEDQLRTSMKQWGEYLQRILWYVNV